jgi:hypothetical protein
MAFRAEMLRAGAAYQVPVDDAMLAVYFEGLQDLDLGTLREAFVDCIQQLKWFPKVVDLRDAEFGVRERADRARTQRLLAAAPERVREAIDEAQWRERWAVLKGIMERVPMKPHHGLDGDACQCADHKRQRAEASRVAR